MPALSDLIVKIGANIAEFESGMAQVSARLGTVAADAEKQLSGLSDFGSSLLALGAGLTAGLTLPLVGVGAAALQAAGNMESAKIGFTTLLGSADAADKMLARLKDFAEHTPFNFPDLVLAAQRMKALGFSADEVIPSLRAIGDATSALGAGPEVMNRIVLALGQMRNSAKLSAQDMNQLTQAGIDGWGFLAKASGTSIQEIREKAKDLYTGAEAATVIMKGMATQFAGGMEAQSKSIIGLWSNVKDSLTFALTDIGAALLPFAKGVVTDFLQPMISGLTTVAHWFQELPAPIQTAALAAAGLLAAAGPLLVAVGGLGLAIPAVTAGFAAIAGAVGIATGPLLLIVGAVGLVTVALVALGTWVYQNWEPIKATVMQAWDGLSELWHGVWDPIAGWLQGAWGAVSTAASTLWKPVASFLNKIWDPIAPYFMAVWNGIGSLLSGVWNGIKSMAETVWNAVTGALSTFLSWAEKIPGVKKLLNLDDAWASAKKLGEQTDANSKSLATHAEAAKTTGTAIKGVKDETDWLAKSQTELGAAERAIAEARKTLYIPSLTDTATAEVAVQAARDAAKLALDNLVTAENNLKAARDSGDKGAIKAATEADTEARKALKAATDAVTQAEKDLATAQGVTKAAQDEMARADQAYITAISSLNEPVIKDYALALGEVSAAKDKVKDAADRLKTAEQLLVDLLSTDGVKSQRDVEGATKNVEAARLTLKTATDNLKKSEADLAASEKTLHAASTEMEQDAQALDTLYKNHLTGSVKSFKDALDDVREAKEQATKAADKLKAAEERLNTVLKQENPTTKEVARATQDAKNAREDLNRAVGKLNTSEQELQTNYGVSKRATVDLTNSTQGLTKAVQDSEAAFSSLGINSAQKLQEVADKSKQAYDTIAADGTVSVNKLRDAHIAALEAEKAALIAQGGDLTREQQSTLDHLKAQQETFNEGHKSQWTTLYNDVNGIVKNWSHDMVVSLFENDGSFGQKSIAALKAIGEAFVDTFLTKATDAIAKFIATTIADLLGGKGLGGVLQNVKDLGKALEDVFGAGSTAASTTASTASTAGGAASGGGSAAGGASSAGGAMGVVNMISGVVTAISSVVSNFQFAHMETSLNAIEHNTRYSMMYLGERADGGILSVLFKIQELVWYGPFVKDIEAIKNFILGGSVPAVAPAANASSVAPDSGSVSLSTRALEDLKAAVNDDDAHTFYVWGLKGIAAIADNTYWSLMKLDAIWAKYVGGTASAVATTQPAPSTSTAPASQKPETASATAVASKTIQDLTSQIKTLNEAIEETQARSTSESESIAAQVRIWQVKIGQLADELSVTTDPAKQQAIQRDMDALQAQIDDSKARLAADLAVNQQQIDTSTVKLAALQLQLDQAKLQFDQAQTAQKIADATEAATTPAAAPAPTPEPTPAPAATPTPATVTAVSLDGTALGKLNALGQFLSDISNTLSGISLMMSHLTGITNPVGEAKGSTSSTQSAPVEMSSKSLAGAIETSAAKLTEMLTRKLEDIASNLRTGLAKVIETVTTANAAMMQVVDFGLAAVSNSVQSAAAQITSAIAASAAMQPLAATADGRPITVNVTGNTVSSQDDADRLARRMTKTLKSILR